jgi:hypothetical protein
MMIKAGKCTGSLGGNFVSQRKRAAWALRIFTLLI